MPDLVIDNPYHRNLVGTGLSLRLLPAQTVLWFYDFFYWASWRKSFSDGCFVKVMLHLPMAGLDTDILKPLSEPLSFVCTSINHINHSLIKQRLSLIPGKLELRWREGHMSSYTDLMCLARSTHAIGKRCLLWLFFLFCNTKSWVVPEEADTLLAKMIT